ncbi:MAG: alpha/beta hydrolase [Propionibacteriales bacterium]|nr:alpha/beta hydrolase [Propionibacteriales bacterium]
MAAAKRGEGWFRYFPGDRPEDYRWSAAFSLLLGTSHWGGAALSEAHRVGQRLADRVGDDEAWFTEFRAAGDNVAELAREDEHAGHDLTAAGAYLRACVYYQIGERFRLPKDDEALDVYRRSTECFQRYAELTDAPRIETLEIPFEDSSLSAYFVHGAGRGSEPGPSVVFFDGLDITKELQYAHGVAELSRRGISTLVVDGPGNGEAIRFRGFPLRHDYETAGTAAYEYLAERDDVAADRIGVLAISLGGYYAPRCAAREPRFAACAAWGAIWDYRETWKRRIEATHQASMSVAADHIAWVLGVETIDEAMDALLDFTLDDVVGDIRCPLLITHGENDAQIPVEDARKLYEAAGSPDKTLRTFSVEEGGAQHCQIDYSIRAASVVADWLKAKL